MTMASGMRGIVLFAHGSRDAAWRAPVEAVARRLAERAPTVPVRCAYLELTAPDLPTAAAEMVALGARELVVLPLFIGVGRHAREDLPRLVGALRDAHPGVRVDLRPAVGEDPRFVELMADLVLA